MGVAPVIRPLDYAADDRIVLHRVSRETYEHLLADDDERRVPRLTYDQGVLELLTPSMPHEEDTETIAQVVKIVSAVHSIPIRSVSSTTFRRRDLQRGNEPDASFYVQHAARIRSDPRATPVS